MRALFATFCFIALILPSASWAGVGHNRTQRLQ
jgi:hypothetical protein